MGKPVLENPSSKAQANWGGASVIWVWCRVRNSGSRAFPLILFTIFYAPCFVTVVCIAMETGSWKWAGFSVVFNTVLAFGLSTAVFQIGSLF